MLGVVDRFWVRIQLAVWAFACFSEPIVPAMSAKAEETFERAPKSASSASSISRR